MSRRRVVVTGLGIVCPVGNTVDEAWSSVTAARSGIARITRFDPTGFGSQIAGEVKGFDVAAYLPPKEARRMDAFIHYGMAASIQAIRDAGVDAEGLDRERIGCVIGSGIGGLPLIEDTHADLARGGPRKISPFFVPGSIINMIAGNLSIMFGFKGPNLALVTACTTANHCIGEGGRLIEYGDADIVIAGGSEATVSPLGVGGFASMRALSTRNDDPESASRPWDRDRDGFVLGEGAGVLVLEALEHAQRRGARIYAELAGDGNSLSSYRITDSHPSGDGPIQAMRQALRDAGAAVDDVDYLNAHGTSTPMNDRSECAALRVVFGDDFRRVAVSSTKSVMGHLIAAAGAVEAAVCALAIHHGMLPVNANLREVDPDCDVDIVRDEPRRCRVRVALSNSLGFGGSNSCLALRNPADVDGRPGHG